MRSFDLAFLKLSTKKNINKCSHEIGKGKFCLLAISKTPMPLKNLLCIVGDIKQEWVGRTLDNVK